MGIPFTTLYPLRAKKDSAKYSKVIQRAHGGQIKKTYAAIIFVLASENKAGASHVLPHSIRTLTFFLSVY
jgi:hypothetical protein